MKLRSLVASLAVNAANSIPRAVFTIRNADILETPSASDKLVFSNRTPEDQLEWLIKCTRIAGSGVKLKIGNDSFRDKVDFNAAYKKPNKQVDVKVGQRRGYKVVIVQLS